MAVWFGDPVHTIASNLAYEAHNPAILTDGTLLVPFADHRQPGDRCRLERQRDWMIVSTDGGQSFSEPLIISESCVAPVGGRQLRQEKMTAFTIFGRQSFSERTGF